MQRAIIYGNGPSLLTAPRTEAGVKRYGVNRSYEVQYAENWVTADARALGARMEWLGKPGSVRSDLHLMPHVFRGSDWEFRENLNIWHNAPSSSGPMAMYIAAKQGAEKVYLVGFDWENRRFYEKEDIKHSDMRRNYHSGALKQIWEFPHVDWRIWRDGWVDATRTLQAERDKTPSEAREPITCQWEETGSAPCEPTHPGRTCSWCE